MRTPIFVVCSSLLLLLALVFLVLATVSVPIGSPFKLAVTDSVQYGLLGYCSNQDGCSKPLYPVAFGDLDDSASWMLSESMRNSLARAFVVCPISAGFTLIALVSSLFTICFDSSVLKASALIFNVLCFLASSVSCVMIVLVFVPHVAWLGWLTVAAAGCTLLSFPLLYFSAGVFGSDDDDNDDYERDYVKTASYTEEKPIPRPSFSNTAYNPSTIYNSGNTDLYLGFSSSRDYSYGDSKNGGYAVTLTTTADSFFESKPKDMIKANPVLSNYSGSNPSNYYNAVNLNSGFVTPVTSNRQITPNFVPSPVATGNTTASPYPPSERGLALYNSAQYGVFDHHPNVEGHQPFTELGDNDLPDRTSVDDDHVLESDEESHFTSVSQRLPNEMYNNNPTVNNNQGMYGCNYQQGPQNMAEKRPFNYDGQSPMNKGPGFYGPPPGQGSYNMYQQAPNNPLFQPQYQLFQPQQVFQPGYQQFPPQGLAYGGAPGTRPINRPTVSENALNSNPDFAIGFNGKRRTGARPMPAASRMGMGPRSVGFSGPGY